ncbi:helicase [Galliscardovia ingluviei]|uniref:Helicase n=1 Tax=Galliscardovia ingluviei TaxID=1769422 RepID=A0A8J3AJZ4_9BIFI|nr:helicase [Galliscardovia ingluviei]
MRQQQALDILKSGASVFLTGAPGSGKTYVLNQFVQWARMQGLSVAMTASTGIAATHINGQTIHSFSGIGVHTWLADTTLKTIRQRRRKIIANTDVLVIDEVSMLHAWAFDLVDTVCRKLRRDERPFGGLQVVLSGDFFQLPPVSNSRRNQDLLEPDEGLLQAREPYARYGLNPEGFITQSLVWQQLRPTICYLDEQHRQDDGKLLHVLTDIRAGRVSAADQQVMNSRLGLMPDEDEVAVHLFPTNAQADKLNAMRLQAIAHDEHVFEHTHAGNSAMVKRLLQTMLAPSTLVLKIGATVMALRNDQDKQYVNGSLGTVIGFTPERRGGWPIVEFANGNTTVVRPADWQMLDGQEVVASVTQVPLRLAWGITIHKSQGMTLDRAVMDLRRTFTPGMGYVALSRVERLSGLYMQGIHARAYEISQEAFDLDTALHDDDAHAQLKLATYGAKAFAPAQYGHMANGAQHNATQGVLTQDALTQGALFAAGSLFDDGAEIASEGSDNTADAGTDADDDEFALADPF